MIGDPTMFSSAWKRAGFVSMDDKFISFCQGEYGQIVRVAGAVCMSVLRVRQ
jgi:3-dehydroquinate dehydratase